MIRVSSLKKLATAVVAGSLALGMAACSSGGSGDSGQVAEGETAKMDLWTFQPLHGEVYETMAAKWNAEKPDQQVELNVTVYPYQDMHNKLQLAANAGEGMPDVVDIEVNQFSNFVKGEASPLLDLAEYTEPYRADVVEARLDLYSRGDKVFALPTHVGAFVTYYNVELLEAAGINYEEIVTWDDYREAGKAYKAATGKNFGAANTEVAFTEELMIAQLGGQLFADEGKGGPTVNSPEVVKALEYSQQMLADGAITLLPGGEPDDEAAMGALNSGEFAALVYPAWFASRFVDSMPDLEGKIAIAPAPTFEDGRFATIGGGGTGTAVAADSDVADRAAEFLAYAKLSEEGNIAVWEDLGFDPVNMAVWEKEDITHNPDNKFNKYFRNNLFDTLNKMKDGIGHFESFANPNLPAVENQLRTVTLNAIYDGGVPAKDALDQTQADVENELGS